MVYVVNRPLLELSEGALSTPRFWTVNHKINSIRKDLSSCPSALVCPAVREDVRIVFEAVSQHCVLTEAKHQHTHADLACLTVETVEVPMRNELNTDCFSIQLKFCSLRLPV